ncbi:MAG: fumarylacetoacetate hydrolase family protein [Sphingomonas sp.]
MAGGTAYGVILNDRAERDRMSAAFARQPYARPPEAPVLYIKPRNTLQRSGGTVAVPGAVVVGSTLALAFGPERGVPIAAALAIDLFEPHESYYRPAIRERCRDGFLPLGAFVDWSEAMAEQEVVTMINGVEAHRWSLSRLARDPRLLAREVDGFMTLADGDILLVGLPGDAARAEAGQTIEVTAAGFPRLTVRLIAEDAA